MRIRVTAEDIRLGCRYAGTACPVARAIGRAIREANLGDISVNVCPDQIRLWPAFTGEYTLYEIPYAARNFIMKFDHGRPVKPFEFELEVSECVSR